MAAMPIAIASANATEKAIHPELLERLGVIMAPCVQRSSGWS
jgi:hypothetical protein